MRGGGGGDAVSRVTGDERKGATSLLGKGVKTAMDGTGCLTSAEVTAGGCCCAAQQEGRVWLCGAGFGQWLQEDCLGCCCMQACRCVEEQCEQTEERRESMQRFLHLYRVGRFCCEVDAFVESFSFWH